LGRSTAHPIVLKFLSTVPTVFSKTCTFVQSKSCTTLNARIPFRTYAELCIATPVGSPQRGRGDSVVVFAVIWPRALPWIVSFSSIITHGAM
jgi:hypothetical protein